MLVAVSKQLMVSVLAVVCALCASCAPNPVHAEMKLQAGVDTWSVPEPMRYTPNYNPNVAWSNVDPWVKVEASGQLGPVQFSIAARDSKTQGSRLDRLDADYRVSEHLGLRLGVMPFRISWCRTYDSSSPWVSELDAFCGFSALSEIANGAFGVQTYATTMWGSWLLDGMASVYRPMVDNQIKTLGPYVAVGETTYHHKQGLAMNAMHLPSGTQFRASYLGTHMRQSDDRPVKAPFMRELDYAALYLAVEGNISERTTYRLTRAQYEGDQTAIKNPYHWNGVSQTAELSHRVGVNTFSLGYARYRNDTWYADNRGPQYLVVPSFSLAWRHELGDGMWVTGQATHGRDTYKQPSSALVEKSGSWFGVRLAKVF